MPEEPPSFVKDPGRDCFRYVNSDTLIEDNRAYLMDPNDISDIDDGSFISGLKRLLLYGTKKKVRSLRQQHISDVDHAPTIYRGKRWRRSDSLHSPL